MKIIAVTPKAPTGDYSSCVVTFEANGTTINKHVGYGGALAACAKDRGQHRKNAEIMVYKAIREVVLDFVLQDKEAVKMINDAVLCLTKE